MLSNNLHAEVYPDVFLPRINRSFNNTKRKDFSYIYSGKCGSNLFNMIFIGSCSGAKINLNQFSHNYSKWKAIIQIWDFIFSMALAYLAGGPDAGS